MFPLVDIARGLFTIVNSVEIKESAYKHGVRTIDMLHAVNNPIDVFPMDGYRILVGAGTDGTLLELGLRNQVIFHAMKARPKYLRRKS